MYAHPAIDLNNLVKLPIVIDCEQNDVNCTHWSYAVTKLVKHGVNELKPYYLNAVLIFNDIVYMSAWLRRARTQQGDMRLKLVVIKPYYVGVEYAHTKPVISKDFPRLLEVVHGDVVLVTYPSELVDVDQNLQKHENKVFMLDLKPGQKAVIPPDWVYIIVNKGSVPGVVLEIHHPKQKTNVVERKKKHPPFYVIVRNEKPEVVKNPRFRFVQNFAWVDPVSVAEGLSLASKTPMLNQFLRSSHKFGWFLNGDFRESDFIDLLLNSIITEDEDKN